MSVAASRSTGPAERKAPARRSPRTKAPTPHAGARGTIVLDTSVLVADPMCIHAFEDVDLVVPLTVVEELDGHKTRRDDVGQAARQALRTIEALRVAHGGDIRTAVALPGGATLRVETNGVHLEELTPGLDPTKADNRILAACCGLRASGASVRVISNDTAMRIKAAQLGFEAVEHVRVSRSVVDDGYGSWPTIEVSTDLLAQLYRSGAPAIPFDDVPLDDRAATELEPNTFAVLRSGSSSVLVRAKDKQLRSITQTQEAYGLRPRSKEQRAALALLLDPEVSVVALDGVAGTGKTILALAAGLEQVVERNSRYERLAIYRPIVPVGKADLGYLPGSVDEKLEPWMSAIVDALASLTDDHSYVTARDTLDELMDRGRLSMESVTFLRGRTLQSSFIVVDEAQNLEPTTVKTILTRVGEGAKVVFCGDRDQIDAPYLSRHNNGLALLLDAFRGHECFGGVRLVTCERSDVAALAAQLL